MRATTIVLVAFISFLIAAIAVMNENGMLKVSFSDQGLGPNVPAPTNTNTALEQEYPVVNDPIVANQDCSVENAVYTPVKGTCVSSDGEVLDGTPGKCGTGTGIQRLDIEASTGFVPASGTGTCELLEKEGDCEVPCPMNCEGGRWVEGDACVRMNSDGSTTALFDGGSAMNGTCGPGQQSMTRITTDTDPDSPHYFKPAVGKGTCTLSKTVACERECAEGVVVGQCGYSGIKVKDTDIGSQVLGHEGCVRKDPNGAQRGAKDEAGNFIPVEEGEDGFERWYEAAYYGDTSKCDNLVEWRSCSGPPMPQDCVGDWIKQPDTDSEWSACKLPAGEVCGATYREKKYHISTPKGTRQVGGVTIDNGKECTATITVDGQDEERIMQPGGQLTYTEWCGESQRVACCQKSDWVYDAAHGCKLDEGGANPRKRYTREVTGACDEDDGDPDGNATEKFEGCCYTSPWEDGLVDAETGKVKQRRKVVNCDTDTATEQEVPACYIAPAWENSGLCSAMGEQKQTRVVHNERLCDPSLDASSTRVIDCDVDCEGRWDCGVCDVAPGKGANDGSQLQKTCRWTTTREQRHGGRACPSPKTIIVEGESKSLPLPGGGSESVNACPKPVNCEGKETAGSCGYAGCGQTRYKTMTYQITKSAAHNGKCDKINGSTRQVSCGTGPCPINCAGYWQDLDEYCHTKGGLAARPTCYNYQWQKYVRTQNGAHGGDDSCPANGKRKKKSYNDNTNCSNKVGDLCPS